MQWASDLSLALVSLVMSMLTKYHEGRAYEIRPMPEGFCWTCLEPPFALFYLTLNVSAHPQDIKRDVYMNRDLWQGGSAACKVSL